MPLTDEMVASDVAKVVVNKAVIGRVIKRLQSGERDSKNGPPVGVLHAYEDDSFGHVAITPRTKTRKISVQRILELCRQIGTRIYSYRIPDRHEPCGDEGPRGTP